MQTSEIEAGPRSNREICFMNWEAQSRAASRRGTGAY